MSMEDDRVVGLSVELQGSAKNTDDTGFDGEWRPQIPFKSGFRQGIMRRGSNTGRYAGKYGDNDPGKTRLQTEDRLTNRYGSLLEPWRYHSAPLMSAPHMYLPSIGPQDIGVPLDYVPNGSIKDSELQIMKGFVATLHENIESEQQRFPILETIRKFTSILVHLKTPLGEWNSLAQYVLREYSSPGFISKRTDLVAKLKECLAIMDRGTDCMGELVEILEGMHEEIVRNDSTTSMFLEKVIRKIEALEGQESTGDGIGRRRNSLYRELEKHVQTLWKSSRRFSYEQLGVPACCCEHCQGVYRNSYAVAHQMKVLGEDVIVCKFEGRGGEAAKCFVNEVRALATLRHPNIAQGIGWCHNDGEFSIVHEPVTNGTLARCLHDPERKLLSWDMRLKIIRDIASSLRYLHVQCDPLVLHGNISSKNVLLDPDFCPKLVSFGLAKFVDPGKEADTLKSDDVREFGRVVLEIVSGRHAGNRFIDEARDLYFDSAEGIFEIADKRLNGAFDQLQMERLITLGLRCTLDNPHIRPSMLDVVKFLRFDDAVPTNEERNMPNSSTSSSRETQTPSSSDRGEDHGEPGTEVEHQIEQTVHDSAPSLAAETFDIGLPADYDSSEPINQCQLEFMKGIVVNLHAKIACGAAFEEVLDIIRSFTSTLTMLGNPLADWNSLAQHLLNELKRIEILRGKQEVDDEYSAALSCLNADLEERLATIEDNIKLAEPEQNSASMELERSSSSTEIGDLQKHIVELQKKIEDVEGTMNLAEDERKAIDQWRAPDVERIEYIESAILILHDSLLSQISSLTF